MDMERQVILLSFLKWWLFN